MLAEKDISNQPNISEPNQVSNIESIKEDNINEKLSENENKLEENSNGNNGRWEKKEHLRFLAGCLLYKNNWKKVETYVRTRTSTQIRSHAQKYLKKLEKKYFSKDSLNKSPNDSFTDDFNFNEIVLNTKDKNDKNKKDNETNNISNKNNNEINTNNNLVNNEEEKKNENDNNDIINNEILNNINNNIDIKEEKNSFLKIDGIENIGNKTRLSEAKINQLVEDLNKENFNIEVIERYIIYIFRPNKKCEDLSKPEIKKSVSKNNNTHNKTSKNIFLCQKQKREINYESKIKDLLNTNNPNDLEQLIKIFHNQNTTQERDILIYLLENN